MELLSHKLELPPITKHTLTHPHQLSLRHYTLLLLITHFPFLFAFCYVVLLNKERKQRYEGTFRARREEEKNTHITFLFKILSLQRDKEKKRWQGLAGITADEDQEETINMHYSTCFMIFLQTPYHPWKEKRDTFLSLSCFHFAARSSLHRNICIPSGSFSCSPRRENLTEKTAREFSEQCRDELNLRQEMEKLRNKET